MIVYDYECINNTNSYTHKKVTHFLHRHYHGSITHDGKNCDKPNAKPTLILVALSKKKMRKLRQLNKKKVSKKYLLLWHG
jgi:hypothetical protein